MCHLNRRDPSSLYGSWLHIRCFCYWRLGTPFRKICTTFWRPWTKWVGSCLNRSVTIVDDVTIRDSMFCWLDRVPPPASIGEHRQWCVLWRWIWCADYDLGQNWSIKSEITCALILQLPLSSILQNWAEVVASTPSEQNQKIKYSPVSYSLRTSSQ